MPTVILKVTTRYNGEPVYPDSKIEVDNKTAQRWAAKKPPICEIVDSPSVSGDDGKAEKKAEAAKKAADKKAEKKAEEEIVSEIKADKKN